MASAERRPSICRQTPTGPLRSPVPGARLLGSWPALAAGVIAFNVYYWRPVHPGFVSGKLSDLGINFLLPVLLVAVAEWLSWLIQRARRRPFRPLGPAGVATACCVSAVYFALLKLVPAFTGLHVRLLELIAWPLLFVGAFRNTADPTDLVTLFTTPLAGWYLSVVRGRPRVRRAA
jgi:hypothetical protein